MGLLMNKPIFNCLLKSLKSDSVIQRDHFLIENSIH